MKIKLNENEIFDFPLWKQKVIQNDICSEEFENDISRRLIYVLEHKFEQCFKRLRDEWLEKLENDPKYESIPLDKKKLSEMILNHHEYKNRSQREKEMAKI